MIEHQADKQFHFYNIYDTNRPLALESLCKFLAKKKRNRVKDELHHFVIKCI